MASQANASTSSCISRREDNTRNHNAGSRDVDFEYEAMKFMFTQKFSYFKYRHVPNTRKELEDCIEAIKSGEKTSNHHAVIEEDGKDILITKKLNPDDPIVRIISIEDSFDVILDAHKATHHGGFTKMMKVIDPSYKIPKVWITFFTKLCKVCTKIKSSPFEHAKAKPFNNAVQINIIEMHAPDDKFKYVLIYLDILTEYIILRPLVDKYVTEVAIELLKIFADFGTPTECSVYDYEKEFFIQTLKTNLSPIWPTEDIVISRLVREVSMHDYKVMSLLRGWMNITGSTNWAIACHMIQWQLNNTPLKSGISPYVALFGGEANKVAKFKPSEMKMSDFMESLSSSLATPSSSGEHTRATDPSSIVLSDDSEPENDVSELLIRDLQNIAPESVVINMDDSDDNDLPGQDDSNFVQDNRNVQKSLDTAQEKPHTLAPALKERIEVPTSSNLRKGSVQKLIPVTVQQGTQNICKMPGIIQHGNQLFQVSGILEDKK